jgi:hypothetical protein
MIWVWRATVKWRWQGNTEKLVENPVPVPRCPPHIPHGLTWEQTRASAVRGRRLNAWAMTRPTEKLVPKLLVLSDICYDSLDGGSARLKVCSYSYRTAQLGQTSTSMPWVGLDPRIPASWWPVLKPRGHCDRHKKRNVLYVIAQQHCSCHFICPLAVRNN